ncbi:hypothetical protein PAXINDRAFT_104081 [Paxillus involutus ATCC 200175]|uniref:Uncharacterized protein n=1 Tax=Paxillus involutus ATCC 200175 TaxID=664439 RepID=A0A0C9SSK4_PAXIN|nr:hypothetical protein PAXINDRAFT_104081 [Paxillus involutus ATCC 200175]
MLDEGLGTSRRVTSLEISSLELLLVISSTVDDVVAEGTDRAAPTCTPKPTVLVLARHV